MANSKTDKVTGLEYYDGSNAITKNLRWVAVRTAQGREGFLYVLSKENDIVGFYNGNFPIWFDERFKDKWLKELEEGHSGPRRVLVVSNESFLLGMAQAIFNLSQKDTGRSSDRQICLHVRTTFHGFSNAICPDCAESVSPNLVMGYLITAASELNELMWEHKGEKGQAVASASDDEKEDE